MNFVFSQVLHCIIKKHMNCHLFKKRTPAEKVHYKLRLAKEVCERQLFMLEIKYRELLTVLRDEASELFNNCKGYDNDVFIEFRYDVEKLLGDIFTHTHNIVRQQFEDECAFVRLRYDNQNTGVYDRAFEEKSMAIRDLLDLWRASLHYAEGRMFDEIIGESAGLRSFSEEEDTLLHCKRCGHKMPQQHLFLFDGKMMCAFCETEDRGQLHLYSHLSVNTTVMQEGRQCYEEYLHEKSQAIFLYDLARSLQLKKKTGNAESPENVDKRMITALRMQSVEKRRHADKLYAKYLKSFFLELYAIIPALQAQDDSYYYLFLRAHVYKEFFVPQEHPAKQ